MALGLHFRRFAAKSKDLGACLGGLGVDFGGLGADFGIHDGQRAPCRHQDAPNKKSTMLPSEIFRSIPPELLTPLGTCLVFFFELEFQNVFYLFFKQKNS